MSPGRHGQCPSYDRSMDATGRSGEPGEDTTPPVADDDFPEFAEPPRHKPPAEAMQERPDESDPDAQGQVDDVIARLRREREQGER